MVYDFLVRFLKIFFCWVGECVVSDLLVQLIATGASAIGCYDWEDSIIAGAFCRKIERGPYNTNEFFFVSPLAPLATLPAQDARVSKLITQEMLLRGKLLIVCTP